MLNSHWLFLPFILQMACMAADEFGFHRRRGLPRWERIGHPLDTLTVLSCMVLVLYVPPTARSAAVFAGLAAFSCLFVTKDESVHRRYCTAPEQWLHAVLFVLHPIVLASVALLWPVIHGSPSNPAGWVHYYGFERVLLILACALTALFAAYQFVYWNLLWHPTSTLR